MPAEPQRPNTIKGDSEEIKKANAENQQRYDQAMANYQAAMQRYNQAVAMITNMLQVQHDTTKAIIQNFRV
jgi:hypothetical protein